MRRLAIGIAALLAIAACGVVGYATYADRWSEHVRAEAERQLSRALKAPVHLGSARLAVGLGFHLSAENLALWPGPEGEATLRIERANASVRPLSLLRGDFRLHRLRLTGATLRVERGPDGAWNLASLGDGNGEPEPPRVPHPEELLSPLIGLENFARDLLEAPDFADEIEVRGSQIAFRDASGPVGAPVELWLREVDGSLRRRRLLGDTRLELSGRLFDAEGERGGIAWQGRRSRSGEIRLEASTAELEMQAVASYLRVLFPGCRVSGRLSGSAAYETSEPGSGQLELDLVAESLEALLRPEHAETYGPVRADRAEAELALSISPQSVALERARLGGGRVELRVNGTLDRPLRPASAARLGLAFRHVDFARARDLLGWLPRAERDTLAAVVAPVEAGRLVHFEARGTATLAGWQELLAGRTLELPSGFAGRVEVADGALRVGRSDRIDGFRGRATFTEDRVRVEEAHAQLNGAPLPTLHLALDGVSHLFASQAKRREMNSGAVPLLGMRALWQSLSPDDDGDEEPPVRTALSLELEHLAHPMFLAPFEDVRASIERAERGVHIVVADGTWAGVPVRAVADWLFEPEEEVHVHVAAEAPRSRAIESERGADWARGHIELGTLRAGGWRQKGAEGGFRARGGHVFLQDVAIDLEPAGRLTGSLALDLSEADAVPFETSFTLADGDVPAVMEILGIDGELVTGRADLAGSFDGFLQPGVDLLHDLSGLLSVEAREGVVNRGIPPVLAIALASEALNPFARRDVVRYSEMGAVLEFGQGVLSTQGLALDGPDLRMFAHGEMELARPPNEIDAEVVLFLFRQLDRAIGRIPVLNLLLLDDDQNLQAAYYELSGPWEEPDARLVPLRSLAAGPATNVLTGVPRFLLRSIEAIEWMLGGGDADDPEAPYVRRPGRPRRS